MNQAASAKSKFLLLLIVALLVVVGAVLFVLLHHEDGDNRVTFNLQDTNGNLVTEDSLKGRWSILVFGFTYCPDICPSQAFTIAKSLDILDQNLSYSGINAVFISVDYLRDDAEHLASYLTHFHSRFIGYRGSELQLDLAVDTFGASYSVTQTGDSDVKVAHSTSIYLIDPDGKIVKELPLETSAERLAKTLSTLI